MAVNPSREALTRALLDAELIQFGRFAQPDDSFWPVAVHLNWLPSYPTLLRQVARALHALCDGLSVDRVLAGPDALAIGVALGLTSDIPVTYVQGDVRDYTAAYAIEGAYDVGHPTVLLVNTLLDGAQARALRALARRVGLDVTAVLGVLDLGKGARETLHGEGVVVRCALTLRDVLDHLAGRGALPPALEATVTQWMQSG